MPGTPDDRGKNFNSFNPGGNWFKAVEVYKPLNLLLLLFNLYLNEVLFFFFFFLWTVNSEVESTQRVGGKGLSTKPAGGLKALMDCPLKKDYFAASLSICLGLLKEKTVILCTHQTRYLSAADTIVSLADGQIKDQGAASHMMPRLGNKMSSVSSNNFR